MLKKITIIGGAGHVGLAFALICASKNIKVHIHDINSSSLELIKNGKLPHKENNAQKILKTVGFTDFQIKNYYVNLLVYPVTVILPSFSSFVAKKLEFTWLSKIDFFVNGFIISAKK